MIGSSKHIILKKTSGQSHKVGMTQKAISDELNLTDLSIIDLQNAVLELQERQTIFVDYWNTEPVEPTEEQVWLVIEGTTEGYIYINGEWLELPLSEKSVYIKRFDNTRYAWNGLEMVISAVPITKESIEALLTGSIYSHDHNVRSVVLVDYNIDMALYDDFEKLDCGANSQFTILNPILKKGFRLTIKGGTLLVPTFSGYTVNWILTSLVTDYVAGSSNVLWCEIRAVGQIYCFWGA